MSGDPASKFGGLPELSGIGRVHDFEALSQRRAT